jgi:hypothetical protein
MLIESGRRLTPAATAACGLLIFCIGAGAQAPAREGNYDFTACWSGTSNMMSFSKTHTAATFEFTGTTRSNIPGSIFDKNTFRCIGFTVTLDGKTSGSNTCESVDKDGDKRMSLFTSADGKTTRETVAGTGKFDGMTTTTVVTPLGPFPELKVGAFQNCNQQTGTYKLK